MSAIVARVLLPVQVVAFWAARSNHKRPTITQRVTLKTRTPEESARLSVQVGGNSHLEAA